MTTPQQCIDSSSLVKYYVEKSNNDASSSSPTGVADDDDDSVLIIDPQDVSPQKITTLAKDFLFHVLSKAKHHFDYRQQGRLVLMPVDVSFALDSMACEQIRQDDDASHEEEEEHQDEVQPHDDDYVPEATEEEDEAEEIISLDDDEDEENNDGDFDPEEEEEADEAADMDESEEMESEDQDNYSSGDEEQEDEEQQEDRQVLRDIEAASDDETSNWHALTGEKTPMFNKLFPCMPHDDGESGLSLAQFQTQWEHISQSDAAVSVEPVLSCHHVLRMALNALPCYQVLRMALNAYLTRVLPLVGSTKSYEDHLHNNAQLVLLEGDELSSDMDKIALDFIHTVMKHAIEHMQYCFRTIPAKEDFLFALEFYAREQMRSQITKGLVLQENNDEDQNAPIFYSIYPSVDEHEDNDVKTKKNNNNNGLSFLQMKQLWMEALDEKGIDQNDEFSSWLLDDISLYRPLKHALDSFIITVLRRGDVYQQANASVGSGDDGVHQAQANVVTTTSLESFEGDDDIAPRNLDTKFASIS